MAKLLVRSSDLPIKQGDKARTMKSFGSDSCSRITTDEVSLLRPRAPKDKPEGHGSCWWLNPMTALTLVMGFYELSLKGQKSD